VCTSVKAKEDNLVARVTNLLDENKSLAKELNEVKAKMSLQSADSILDSKTDINGVNIVTAKFEDMDMDTLRNTADTLRD
ncbi:DHHA1 domain-containing protein, partial [Faecalibacillus intestinalis]